MRWCAWIAVAVLCMGGTAIAQNLGEVTAVDLPGGTATLSLDFSDRDYELILYSTATDVTDTSRVFRYTVSNASASPKPAAFHPAELPAPAGRDRLDAQLRRKERELAARLRREGGWHPPPRKPAQMAQADSARTFTFSAFGDVTSDRTVQATLVASNGRALGYLDDALPASEENIAVADIQAMLDQFNNHSYPFVTQVFGEPSDVDGNGKVIFLFTHLVDRVGYVAGFYASESLFSTDRGGNGNQADMMFISPTRQLSTYRSLLAHEFQHLINFNQHTLVHDGDAEESWLNEALSHLTEDLVDGHLDGGNTDLIAEFMETPGGYTLTSDDSPLLGGNRGVAYLFLRGLIDEFGGEVPGRLVQTGRAGISNVEAVTGAAFRDLQRSFAARLFLSGNGLNEASSYNFAFKYFTESTTGYRSLPTPVEARLSAQTPSVSGTVKPVATAFVRLSGSGSEQKVEVRADADGAFQALLIPLPRGFLPRLALPVDRFPGVTLNAPLPGVYTAGESVEISGTVQDTSITQLLLSFEPRAGGGEAVKFSFDAAGGQFGRDIIFDPSQAGEYTMTLFGGQMRELLSSIGSLPGAIVTEGTGSVDLPATYFSGVMLSAPLPTRYAAGSGASFSGQVTDPGIEVILMVFTSQEDGSEIRVQTGVSAGAFRKGFVFTPEQAGTYKLDIFGGSAGGGLPHLGGFSPVTVTATGSEEVSLPVDFFSDIVLGAPLATRYTAGTGASFSGRAAGATIQILKMVFTPQEGGDEIVVQAGVSDGAFRKGFVFAPEQAGAYRLDIYGGSLEGGLPHLGAFEPIVVAATGSERVFLPVDFFNSILLDAPMAATYLTDGTETFSGRVTDASVEVLIMTFTPAAGGEEVRVQVDVSEGTFRKEFSFGQGQVGSYTLSLFGGPRGGSIPHLGTFSPAKVLLPQPDLLLRQTALTWGEIPVGQSRDLQLVLLNTGSGALSVGSISAVGAPFSVAPDSLTLAPGDSAAVTVTFAPADTGAVTGTLRIVSDDPDRSTIEVALAASASALAAAPSPDFTGDGQVNFSDFVQFAKVFGATQGDPDYSVTFDLDENGEIGFSDFITFARAFGKPL